MNNSSDSNNEYHNRVRSFAKGDIANENLKGNNKMVRIRLPIDVYRELRILAINKDIPVGRLIIELLRTFADKSLVKRKAEESEYE